MSLALSLGGEIIGCDALQLYRGFDVATAKSSLEDRRRVPHHLVDEVEPARDFNLADYVRSADAAIRAVRERGRLPIVCGGTGLYLRGLLRGVVDAPARDEKLRERLRNIAWRRGSSSLHRWLTRIDAESALRIPTGDTQRVARALELALSGGASWSRRLPDKL